MAAESRAMGIEEFWRTVKSVLRLKPLRLADGRRNVVQVLSAEEARQWVLPVVFVCGMVEKQFPRFHRQDPFFPDAARCRLNAAGIRVRTAAEFEREERALFESAISQGHHADDAFVSGVRRARRAQLALALPGRASAGGRGIARGAAPAAPRSGGAAARRKSALPGLLEFLREKTAKLSPTDLESFLQCPFQYFGRRTLRLKPAPSRPARPARFPHAGKHRSRGAGGHGGRTRGTWRRCSRTFSRAMWKTERIPSGYHTERLRNAMLDDLRGFAGDGPVAARRFPIAHGREICLSARRVARDLGQDRPARYGAGWPRLRDRLQVQQRAEHQGQGQG